MRKISLVSVLFFIVWIVSSQESLFNEYDLKGWEIYGTRGSASPLKIIDGVSGGNLDMLKPSEIESISM